MIMWGFSVLLWTMLAKVVYDNFHFGIDLIIFCIYPFVMPSLLMMME